MAHSQGHCRSPTHSPILQNFTRFGCHHLGSPEISCDPKWWHSAEEAARVLRKRTTAIGLRSQMGTILPFKYLLACMPLHKVDMMGSIPKMNHTDYFCCIESQSFPEECFAQMEPELQMSQVSSIKGFFLQLCNI